MLKKYAGQVALFFDTETTGLPIDCAPASQQPRVVQLAFVMGILPETADCEFEELTRFKSLCRLDDGIKIHSKAEEVHGISTTKANRYGAGTSALRSFCDAAMRANVIVAHNIDFDKRLILYWMDRLGWPHAGFRAKEEECTQELMRDVCKLPPTERMLKAGRTGFKSPRLEEAHQHLFGEGLDGAHDALVDVDACKRVFIELMMRELYGP